MSELIQVDEVMGPRGAIWERMNPHKRWKPPTLVGGEAFGPHHEFQMRSRFSAGPRAKRVHYAAVSESAQCAYAGAKALLYLPVPQYARLRCAYPRLKSGASIGLPADSIPHLIGLFVPFAERDQCLIAQHLFHFEGAILRIAR